MLLGSPSIAFAFGISASQVGGLHPQGRLKRHIDRPALAQRAASLILHMIFEDGFFHADPHPGNFFV